jgi:protein-disulfide isomerase
MFSTITAAPLKVGVMAAVLLAAMLSSAVPAIAAGTSPSSNPPRGAPEGTPRTVEVPAYHEFIEGDAAAKVTVIEYASLTCPHCARFYANSYPTLKKDYIDTGKIKFIFRDFPTAPEELAMIAAMIARCAPGDGGKGMIADMLANQEEWMQSPKKILAGYGAKVGLTIELMDACIKDEALLDVMTAVIDHAVKDLKVHVTPTFIVGEQKVEGEPLEPLRQAIDQALAKAP